MKLSAAAIGTSGLVAAILDRSGVRERVRQEGVRLLLCAVTLAYLVLFAWKDAPNDASILRGSPIFAATIYVGVLLALFVGELFVPAVTLAWLFAGLFVDFFGIALALQSGSARLIPVILILLWAGSWYAVRLGARLMIVPIAMAVATMLLLWLTDPFWRSQPYLTATLIVMAGGIPAYASYLTAETRAANRRLTDHLAGRARLLARVGHDLRHPLHALGIFNARLANTEMTAQQRQLVERIDLALRNSTEMLQSYLDLASIEANQIRPNPTVFPVQSLFDELADQGRAAAERAGVRFCFMRTSRYVRADRTFLKAMLQNLIANVIRHAPGSRAVVGCRLNGRNLMLQVCDTGGDGTSDGIDRSPGNYGLGLTIVRDLARTQNLRVWINDRFTKGFDVRILGLPAAGPTEESHPAKTSPEFQPLRGTRVLLVEGNDTLREETTALLHQWGCHVAPRADLPTDAVGCDVAIVNARSRMLVTGRAIARLGVPTILLADVSAKKVEIRRDDARLIQAARPVTPAQLRSMLMSVR